MNIYLKSFLKGIVIGMLFLPLEFAVLSLEVRRVQAQDLREIIRSQVSDLRDRPCDEDPRQSCSRPIPTHRPEPTPEPSGQPTPTPTPIPGVTPTPGISPSPTPTATPGTGGNGECECCKDCGDCSCDCGDCSCDCEDDCDDCGDNKLEVIIKDERTGTGGPQVLGLSYTGSGNW